MSIPSAGCATFPERRDLPAFATPENGALRITFSREGENDEQRVADNGVKAVSIAMRMLALREELQPSDTLTVAANRPVSVR
jgi:hypothetical protein